MHTDGWAAYAKIFNPLAMRTTGLRYKHTAHNHSSAKKNRFKDTALVESLWAHLKLYSKRIYNGRPGGANHQDFFYEMVFRAHKGLTRKKVQRKERAFAEQ